MTVIVDVTFEYSFFTCVFACDVSTLVSVERNAFQYCYQEVAGSIPAQTNLFTLLAQLAARGAYTLAVKRQDRGFDPRTG